MVLPRPSVYVLPPSSCCYFDSYNIEEEPNIQPVEQVARLISCSSTLTGYGAIENKIFMHFKTTGLAT